MQLKQKLAKLKKILLKCNSCLIAFSGGVDSTFLLRVASEVLPKERVLAVTADSPTYPAEELFFARRIAREFGARHKVIGTRELKNKNFYSNPVDRCYFCKSELFSKLKSIAKQHNLNIVAEASTLSDRKDFRPGNIAKKELKIRSPLEQAGFTKEDVRKLSRVMGLKTWDKSSLACLASRIPYGVKISSDLLRRIHRAELYLKELGFKQVRLRHYNGLCRIEVLEGDIARLLKRRNQVIDKLKKLGYNYVTLDLEGYRTGSLNEVIER